MFISKIWRLAHAASMACTLVGLVCLSSDMLAGDVSEDFEGASDLVGWAQTGGWIIEVPSLVRLSPEHAKDGNGGIGIGLADADSGPAPIYKTKLGLLGPVVELVWDVRVDQEGVFDLFARGLTDETNETETIATIRIHDGTVSCAINGGGGFVDVGSISVGEWNRIKVLVDFNTQRYQVSIGDGPPSPEMHFATNTEQKINELDWIGFAKVEAGPGAASFDNISATSASSGSVSTSKILEKSIRLPIETGDWQSVASTQKGEVRKSVDGLGTISSSEGSGEASEKASVITKAKEVLFSLPGDASAKQIGKWRWSIPQKTVGGAAQYASFRFKGRGFLREIGEAYPVIKLVGIGLDGRRGEAVLQDANRVFNDGREHFVIARFKAPIVPESVQVQLVTADSSAQFSLSDFVVYGDLPEIDAVGLLAGALPKVPLRNDLMPVDLTKLFNRSLRQIVSKVLEKAETVVDGGNILSVSRAVIDGIPFEFGTEKHRNVAASLEIPSGNDQKVPFLKGEVPRLAYGPNARDDSLEVPIGRSASELFLCLSSENGAFIKRAVSAGFPFQFDDIEAFSIEIRYEDGESDLAFPISLSDGRPVIRQLVGSYVVPTDPRRSIKSIVLRNRVFGNTVGLLALTLNSSENRKFPHFAQETPVVRPPRLEVARQVEPSIRKEGSRIVAENSFYRLVINTAKGLSMESWSSGFALKESFILAPESGLEIHCEDKLYRGSDLVFEKADFKGGSASLQFSAKSGGPPVRVILNLSVDSGPELAMSLALQNTGDKVLKPTVKFPVIRDLKIGRADDTWFLFPQYRNVISNQPGRFRARNDREFPMQFLDIYNPQAGLGLGVLTRNRGYLPMIYSLEKNDRGVTSAVEYSGDFYPIEAGETRQYAESVFLSHTADWHETFSAYQRWLATWRSSERPQDRQWIERIFWMHSLINSAVLSELYNHTPTFFDSEKARFDIDGVVEAEHEIFGILPDAIDFFAWFYSDATKSFTYGETMDQSYANAGGLPALRQALDDLGRHEIKSGFYMIPDRISTSVAFAREHGTNEALKTSAGNLMLNSEEIFMCPGSERWISYFSDLCRQLQADTNVNFIYLDVFAFTAEMSCYSTEHGHAVPFAPNQATDGLLRALRGVLPEKTGVFAEYPANDVSNERLDGNLTYYFLPLERYITPYNNVEEVPGNLVKGVTHLYRFAFPLVKQLSFAFGIEGDTWGHLKATFFNGDAVFDGTWRLYYPRTRDFLRKSLTIKREYMDCFTTHRGVPMVQTERSAVFANKFPGEERILWTLYNEGPTTLRGTMIAVQHTEGATYFDVWNGRELSPEIKDGKAYISLKLDPQGLGCVVQRKGAVSDTASLQRH